jgi:hypothetical protein
MLDSVAFGCGVKIGRPLALTLVAVLPVAACLVGCRREKPEPPKAPVREIAVAPTPVVRVETNRARRPVITPESKALPAATNAPGKWQRPKLTPEEAQALKERQQAVRERRRAFERERAAKALPEVQRSREQALEALERKEAEVRERDPAVRDAYAKVLAVRGEYEAACARDIAGYADRVKESETLRARLDELLGAKNRGETVDLDALKAVHRQLNDALRGLSGMKTQANASVPGVTRALQAVVAQQSAYEQVLMGNKDYEPAKRKADELSADVARLTSMQTEHEQEK